MVFLLTIAMVLMCAPFAIGQRVLRGQPNIPSQPQVETKGCPTEGISTMPPADARPNDFVELQRTTCFGSCPSYSVQIHADGQITWKGDRSVRITGAGAATIKPSDARALIEKFRTRDFWSLCGSYSASISDGATVITTVHFADQEKRVSDYFNTAPGWLQTLESEIDALADTHQWIHGDPRNETFASVRSSAPVVSFPFGITAGLDADFRGPKPGLTPLMQAAAKNDISEIQKQLAAKADPNAQDSSGWTALMYATRANKAESMKMLLDAGANPNVRSYMGQTALMAVSTIYREALEKLRLLIAARADTNAQDNDGHTGLMFAMYGSLGYEDTDRGFLERVELVSLLREAGARTDLRDAAGLTVFDYLDEEAKRYRYNRSQPEKLRQILQNPTPGIYPPVKVSGRVVVSSVAPLWASTIEFQRVGVGLATVQTAVRADGSFEFPMVQPGPYTVSLAPAPSFSLPPISVVIPNKDVTGLDIRIPSIKEVSVQVTAEGDIPTPNFGLIFVALSGPAATSGPPPRISSDVIDVVPASIQSALAAGATNLQFVRLGMSPLVDDATFRIALPSPWSSQKPSVSSPLPDGSFRITLPEGDYQVGAILPRLRGGLPRIYIVKSLSSGSANLLSEPLKILGSESVGIRATFGTQTPGSWVRLSGRVVGIAPGTEGDVRVVLAGEIIGTLHASIKPDGSFEFPRILQGQYIVRVAPSGMETIAAARPRTPSDKVITVADKDVTGIEVVVPR
jgi:hypothetical protein